MVNGQVKISGHAFFIIVTTSVVTVMLTFWGMSAWKVNVTEPNVPYFSSNKGLGVAYARKDASKTSRTSSNGGDYYNDVTYDVNYDDAEEYREIATHAPEDKCIKRLPQAIIAGIQKCGTTALLKFLDAHPQIAGCLTPAETMYFSVHYNKPLDWYKNLMPCSYSNQVTMEKSPPYFYRGFCADRIRKMDPKTKILLIVKDPVVRTESMYAMIKGQLRGTSFETAVTINNRTAINTKTRLITFSQYPRYMGAWLRNFGQDQILVVDGHNFQVNPAEELGIIEKFLGIGTYFTEDKFLYNETKGQYCLMTSEKGIQCLSPKKGRKHPVYGSGVRKLLEDYFRPMNEKFFQMINRRFDWGY